jgi:hypothetical protein
MMSKGQAINLIYNNTDIWHIVVFLSLKRIAEFCFVLSDIAAGNLAMSRPRIEPVSSAPKASILPSELKEISTVSTFYF